MAKQIINIGWRNGNAYIKYPFTDTSTLQAWGAVFLPDDLFIDASLYAPFTGFRVYLGTVVRTATSLAFVFSDGAADVATAEILVATLLEASDEYITLPLLSPKGTAAGCIVLTTASLQLFSSLIPGTYAVDPACAVLCPDAVTKLPDTYVRSITAGGVSVTGSVKLYAGRGFSLAYSDSDGRPVITLNAQGDPTFIADLPDVRSNPVLTINGESPDAYGNYNIVIGGYDDGFGVAEAALRVLPIENGVLVKIADGT